MQPNHKWERSREYMNAIQVEEHVGNHSCDSDSVLVCLTLSPYLNQSEMITV